MTSSFINSFHRSELCQWLWSRVVQKDLDNWVKFRNGVVMRKQNDKLGPSGMSRDDAYFMPETWGSVNCLLPVDVQVVHQLKEELGGESLTAFTSPEFSAKAELAFEALQAAHGAITVERENAWIVFKALLPFVFPERFA